MLFILMLLVESILSANGLIIPTYVWVATIILTLLSFTK